MTGRMISPEEAARRVSFNRDAIVRAIKRGELEASKLCGRWRIAEEALERWIAGGRPEPVPAPAAAPVRQGQPRAASFRERARRAQQ